MFIEETVKVIISKEDAETILNDEDYDWVEEEIILNESTDGHWLVDVDSVRSLIGIFEDLGITDYEIFDAEASDFPEDEEDE